MNKNLEITTLDPSQIARRVHSEKNDATRVEIVAGPDVTLNVNTEQITEAVKAGLQDLKIEVKYNKQEVSKEQVIVKEVQIVEVQKLLTQYEIQKIEVPVIVKEIEYREIEKPVYITEIKTIEIEKQVFLPQIKIIEIEKPIIVTEIVYKHVKLPSYITVMLLIETLTLLALVANLFKK
jgi:hypothetical protein